MPRSTRLPSPAMLVALVALVIALGGTSYAAITLPKNSVGTKQIRKHAVTASKIKARAVTKSKIRANAVRSSKVKDGSLLAKDFKAGQLPAGPKGDKGEKGDAGASALNPVPSGQTIRGAVGGDFHAFDSTASDFGVDVTLPIPARNALSDADVFVNVSGWQDAGGQTAPTTSDADAGCTGSPVAPTAPAGKVCIYVSGADHAFNLSGYSVLAGTGASPYGFKLKWDASTAGDTFVDATWAYPAPYGGSTSASEARPGGRALARAGSTLPRTSRGDTNLSIRPCWPSLACRCPSRRRQSWQSARRPSRARDSG